MHNVKPNLQLVRNSWGGKKKMFITRRLLHACRITLFSRDDCGLCTQAKDVLSNVWDKRPFHYTEVNLAKPEFKHWKNLYDFDIPVVSSPLLGKIIVHYTDAH